MPEPVAWFPAVTFPVTITLAFVVNAQVAEAEGRPVLNEQEVVQPFESVTVTVYVPAVRLLMEEAVAPLLHE
jgi:hypothetical protein